MVYDPETETMVDTHLEEEPRVRLPQTITKDKTHDQTITASTSVSNVPQHSTAPPLLQTQQSSSSLSSEKAIIVSADVITHPGKLYF